MILEENSNFQKEAESIRNGKYQDKYKSYFSLNFSKIIWLLKESRNIVLHSL